MSRRTNERLFMWAGGKTKMLPHFVKLFPQNIPDRPYVEPFAGGAAVFDFLSARGLSQSTLGDVNAELMDLYRLVQRNPQFLISEMERREAAWMPLGLAERKKLYYELRRLYWSLPDGEEATALLYFLMKTGFNGIWQTCRESKGRFGTPVGLANQKERVFSPDTILAWSEKLSGTVIHTGAYHEIEVPEGAFIYCDPPYRDSFTSYATTFPDEAQIRLIAWCRQMHHERGATVWLSNREAGDGFFETHAGDAALHRFPITYTAGRRKVVEGGFEAKPATELLMIWS